MTDLVKLDDYKMYRGQKSNEKDSARAALIRAISFYFENYCGRKFLDYFEDEFTEYFDAKTNVVYPSNWPLQSVTSIQTSTDGGVTQVLLVEGTDYLVDLVGSKILTFKETLSFLSSYNTPHKSLEVIYKGGFENTPDDLRLALYDTVRFYEDEEHPLSKNLATATLDNAQPYIATSLPSHIRHILDNYRTL